MKTAEQYAKLVVESLGLLPFDDYAAKVTPYFKKAMSCGMRMQREQLPEQLKPVIEAAYDVVFDIIMNKPSAEECVKRLLTISPSLHAARHPSMHG